MFTIAGGILLALAAIFIGIPVAFYVLAGTCYAVRLLLTWPFFVIGYTLGWVFRRGPRAAFRPPTANDVAATW